MQDQTLILTPYPLNPQITLKNRIVMAPMTRRHADAQGCPTREMAQYYARRADAGLILTEGTLISEDAVGYGNVPGIFTPEQIKSWWAVTNAVHERQGLIFLQLWHCGRVSHHSLHNGKPPISASSTNANLPLGNSGLYSSESRAATQSEIQTLTEDYAHAAKNAIQAGFDGVEIHGANGYLIDQFLHYCSNHRDDEFGGTPENISRFCIEVVNACADAIGSHRVGLRLSPGGHMFGIATDPRDKLVFSYLLRRLSNNPIAYIHIGNFDDSVLYPELENKTMTDFARQYYRGTLITSGGYDYQSASTGIAGNRFDLIALGRPFIANSDLITKLHNGQPWVPYNPSMLSDLY